MLPSDSRLDALRNSLEKGAANGDVCISGAAKGCDLLWGEAAVEAGMEAVHWSFADHRTPFVSGVHGRLCRLSHDTLELAAPAMEKVARLIGRRLSHAPHVRPLLLRDFFQVAWSQSLYAVSTFKPDGQVDGGTAWAVGAFRMLAQGNAYLYCQTSRQWFISASGQAWEPTMLEDIPVPQGIWAGIGTREPEASGRGAIAAMSARMFAGLQNQAGCTLPRP